LAVKLKLKGVATPGTTNDCAALHGPVGGLAVDPPKYSLTATK